MDQQIYSRAIADVRNLLRIIEKFNLSGCRELISGIDHDCIAHALETKKLIDEQAQKKGMFDV